MTLSKEQKPNQQKPSAQKLGDKKSPVQSLGKIEQKQMNKQELSRQVVQQISQINILRQQMVQNAQTFHSELQQLQQQLIKKSNELQVMTSKQMSQISEKNITLVSEFVKYQEGLINKLEGKHSNWDCLEHELNMLQLKFTQQMDRKDLPTKLAKISAMEYEIQQLIKEVEEISREKDRKW